MRADALPHPHTAPPTQANIDEAGGGRVGLEIRVPFDVPDSPTTTDRLVAAGADLVAPPTVTR